VFFVAGESASLNRAIGYFSIFNERTVPDLYHSMKAMILAAGRGARMRPLTDHTPKPLLRINGKPMIQFHIEALAAAGFRQLVINHSHLGGQIEAALGAGSAWGVEIRFSPEFEALETGGGILNALPLLGDGAFLVVNGDIWTDYGFRLPELGTGRLAHLVLVDNPSHNPTGDFVLERGLVHNQGRERYTFSGIGLYHPRLFADCCAGAFPLGPLLRHASSQGLVSGEHHPGRWMDVGTPNRLRYIEEMLQDET